MKRLTMMAHGDAGSGKSWLFATAPGPRLLLDAEGRAEHLPGHVVYWNPSTPLPEATTDTTVVIDVRSWNDLATARKVLDSGNHYFASVGLDSVTEAQDRLVESVRGSRQADLQDWGEIFDKLNDYVLALKDLRRNAVRPIDVVYVVAGTDERAGKMRPYVRGQLAKKLPYRFDVVGYLSRKIDPTSQERYRDLLIDSAGQPIEAKSNIDALSLAHPTGHITNPDLSEMLAVINPPEEAN